MTDTRPKEALPAPAAEILEKAGRLTTQELEDLGRAWGAAENSRPTGGPSLDMATAAELAVWDKLTEKFGNGKAAAGIADAVLGHMLRDRISDDSFKDLCQPWNSTQQQGPTEEPILDSLLRNGWPGLAGRTAQLILSGRRFPVTDEEIQALRDHGLIPKHVRVFADGPEKWLERND